MLMCRFDYCSIVLRCMGTLSLKAYQQFSFSLFFSSMRSTLTKEIVPSVQDRTLFEMVSSNRGKESGGANKVSKKLFSSDKMAKTNGDIPIRLETVSIRLHRAYFVGSHMNRLVNHMKKSIATVKLGMKCIAAHPPHAFDK